MRSTESRWPAVLVLADLLLTTPLSAPVECSRDNSAPQADAPMLCMRWFGTTSSEDTVVTQTGRSPDALSEPLFRRSVLAAVQVCMRPSAAQICTSPFGLNGRI